MEWVKPVTEERETEEEEDEEEEEAEEEQEEASKGGVFSSSVASFTLFLISLIPLFTVYKAAKQHFLCSVLLFSTF